MYTDRQTDRQTYQRELHCANFHCGLQFSVQQVVVGSTLDTPHAVWDAVCNPELQTCASHRTQTTQPRITDVCIPQNTDYTAQNYRLVHPTEHRLHSPELQTCASHRTQTTQPRITDLCIPQNIDYTTQNYRLVHPTEHRLHSPELQTCASHRT